jgi:hypothetical protein
LIFAIMFVGLTGTFEVDISKLLNFQFDNHLIIITEGTGGNRDL